MAPVAELEKIKEEDYVSEYVGGGNSYFGNRLWTGYADSLQPNLTRSEIERARRDDEISSSVEFLIDSIFSDGLQITSSVHIDDPGSQKAVEIADFCASAISAAEKNFFFTLRNQFRAAFYHGFKVGEIVLRYENSDRFENKLILRRVNLKPLDATAFVTDQFENELGLIAAQDDRKNKILKLGSIEESEVIPREKFQILSFEHDDNDPRGLTQIKGAYESLTDKRLTRLQYKEWRRTSAIPKKVGITEPGAAEKPLRDPISGEFLTYANGAPKTRSAQAAMLEGIAEMANNSAISIPNGADLKQLEVFGSGEQFERSFKLNNNGIRKSILGDALATGAADKDARAARQSSMNIVDLRVKSFRTIVCICVRRDLLTLLTRANFEEKYWHLVPDCSLGDTERRDWATDISAASGAGYQFAPQHLPELDKQFGLDPRSTEDEIMPDTPENEDSKDGFDKGGADK